MVSFVLGEPKVDKRPGKHRVFHLSVLLLGLQSCSSLKSGSDRVSSFLLEHCWLVMCRRNHITKIAQIPRVMFELGLLPVTCVFLCLAAKSLLNFIVINVSLCCLFKVHHFSSLPKIFTGCYVNVNIWMINSPILTHFIHKRSALALL